MSTEIVIAFAAGWACHFAVALGYIGAIHRRHSERVRRLQRANEEREHDIRIEEKLRAHGIFQEHIARVKDIERQRAEFLASPLPKLKKWSEQ